MSINKDMLVQIKLIIFTLHSNINKNPLQIIIPDNFDHTFQKTGYMQYLDIPKVVKFSKYSNYVKLGQ